MTQYIPGPDTGKTDHIRAAGGILLERVPQRLAPTGKYVCVVQTHGGHDAAAVVDEEHDLAQFANVHDMRNKNWLHVTPEVLDKLLDQAA